MSPTPLNTNNSCDQTSAHSPTDPLNLSTHQLLSQYTHLLHNHTRYLTELDAPSRYHRRIQTPSGALIATSTLRLYDIRINTILQQLEATQVLSEDRLQNLRDDATSQLARAWTIETTRVGALAADAHRKQQAREWRLWEIIVIRALVGPAVLGILGCFVYFVARVAFWMWEAHVVESESQGWIEKPEEGKKNEETKTKGE
ncbi:hypothetical protein M011DRAFT_475910 [Sporormia fimetaria CBS 119925]|uniref:Uncharacterized protein n=1 Tax=Sporormia fimetaria CBS 119925 TaxID=1340428 RepID=A0A6A6VEY9_9PLEO|nr:hypothetical protein M011DRAFT_475910 [Sporormia fimetaria CBS 119925]